jgi:UDP-N-acetylmuramoyl-L-alanyl-D-glutamate--2,6-diaminopimelate ligase
VERGAAAIVGSLPDPGLGIPYIKVSDSHKALPYLAAAFYDFPGRRLTVLGVTGTDGKTTTANLIYTILQAAGIRAGLVTTVNAVIGDKLYDTGFHVTTPDPVDMQSFLGQMVEAGMTHAVLEATSHGLAQGRVDACFFDVGVITNVTHEHLDYHGTYEAYLAAKGRLFASLDETPSKEHNPPRVGVLNRDDASYEVLAQLTSVRQVTYGFRQEVDLHAENILQHREGLRFLAVGKGFAVPVISSLLGFHNVSNCLAALAATILALDVSPEVAVMGVAAMPEVPGRMERIDVGQDFSAIVDFAHTPNALRNALATARLLASGRLIAIIGSAGLRDRLKRKLMAQVSLESADLTILTAEDPRTESLEDILAEMAAGAVARGGVEGVNFWRIPDRDQAIRLGVTLAKPGDILIVCGKGHEQSMCFGTTEYPWDDRLALRAAISERLRIKGPQMPDLPTTLKGNVV